MFDFIRGVVAERSPTRIVVDVGGVGYLLKVPLSTFEKVPPSGEVSLLVHTYVREDRLDLYGFATHDERRLFEMLLNVNGVGPNMALTVLSGSTPAQFRRAVEAGDAAALKTIKGVGEKKAQRLVVELKDTVADLAVAGGPAPTGPEAASEEAVRALESLGLSRARSQKAVAAAAKEVGPDATTEALVREALKRAG